MKDLLGRYGAAGIVTHHENKDPLAKGLNKVSGSARIPAAVWGIWQLSAIDPNNDKDPRRWLKVKPREGESVTLSLEINPKDLWSSKGIFEFLGEFGDESGEKRSHGERVIALLRKYSPKGLEYQEIDAYLQIGRTLYSILDRLEDRQLITKRRSLINPKKWVYAVPCDGDDDIKKSNCHKGDSPPPSVDQKTPLGSTVTIELHESEVIQQTFSTSSAVIQQIAVEKEVLKSQNEESASTSVDIQQNHQLGGGEGVSTPAESQLSHPSNTKKVAQSALNTRVQFLAERFPHAHFGGFKALTRGDSRETVEAAIAAITSAEVKERVMGFWSRIEARFAEE